MGTTYPYFDSCKKYWRCDGGYSIAQCCPGYEQYNATSGECEYQDNAVCGPEQCDNTSVPGMYYAMQENLSLGASEQQKSRPAYPSTQSDQRLCHFLPEKHYI